MTNMDQSKEPTIFKIPPTTLNWFKQEFPGRFCHLIPELSPIQKRKILTEKRKYIVLLWIAASTTGTKCVANYL